MRDLLLQKKTFSTGLIFIMFWFQANAQIPEGVPQPGRNTKLDLTSPTNIILYVVIPILLVSLYFYLRYLKRKRNRRNED